MNRSFGKLYAKTYTGSMAGAGPHVFAVWGYCIANAMPPEGLVEINPRLLANMIGMTEAEVTQAVEYLLAPDPESRTPIDEGRRLRHVSAFEYRLVNFEAHRNGADVEARKEYFRNKKRESRQRNRQVQPSNHDPRDTVGRVETVLDNVGQSKSIGSKAGKNLPPSNMTAPCNRLPESAIRPSNDVKRDVFDMSNVSTQAEAEAEAEADNTLSKGSVSAEPPHAPKKGERFSPAIIGESGSEPGGEDALASEIYAAYPKKAARPEAIEAIKRALLKNAPAYLLQRTRLYADSMGVFSDRRFIPHAAKWFDGERYNDDPSTWETS